MRKYVPESEILFRNYLLQKLKYRCCLLKWEFSKENLPPMKPEPKKNPKPKLLYICKHRTLPSLGRINIHVWDYLVATNRDPFDFWIFTHILDKIREEKRSRTQEHQVDLWLSLEDSAPLQTYEWIMLILYIFNHGNPHVFMYNLQSIIQMGAFYPHYNTFML